MSGGGLMPVAEAQARILALAPPPPAETVPLRAAAGRWLMAPVVARHDQPPFDAAAMDGWAVAGQVAPGAAFRPLGEVAAGRPFAGRLAPGEAVRIFTGAPVPGGATAVLIQEDAEVVGGTVRVKRGHDTARHVRPRGGDFAAGFALSPPLRLRPVDLALAAAMGAAELRVARAPAVAVLATGDELVPPGDELAAGRIFASNGAALAAMAEAEGARVRLLPLAPDREDLLAATLRLAEGADLIVTTGGASVGDHDLVARVAAGLGMQAALHRIAMRPGKPLMAGRLLGAAMLGLPGNPVSSIVCGHVFMLPLIRAMQGDPDPLPRPRRAVLAAPVEATGPRTHYMRARLQPGDGLPGIAALPRQDSSLLSVLAAADALLIREAGDGPRAAGATVSWLPLR